MKPNTITALLAIIAVLLGLNLSVNRQGGRAEAQPADWRAGACCLPNGNCWAPVSESQCLDAGGVWQGEGSSCAFAHCIEQLPPTVVAASAYWMSGTPRHLVWRIWSDGQIDVTRVSEAHDCAPVTDCGPLITVPGTCPSDINRNAEVEVTDFLQLIGEWGPCSP